jgi:hypothetical protein
MSLRSRCCVLDVVVDNNRTKHCFVRFVELYLVYLIRVDKGTVQRVYLKILIVPLLGSIGATYNE